MKPITISEAVAELRDQITQAQADQPDAGVSFEIVEAQLQIHGSLSRSVEAGGSGKVKFTVFGIGGEAGADAGTKRSAETAHTVTLKLDVKDRPGGDRVKISTDTKGNF